MINRYTDMYIHTHSDTNTPTQPHNYTAHSVFRAQFSLQDIGGLRRYPSRQLRDNNR